VSIPEVESKNRLLAFIERYLRNIKQRPWIYIPAYGSSESYAFKEDWENYGGGTYGEGAFMKDTMGFVHLRGLVKSTDVGAAFTIFTLPPGFRPSARCDFAVPGQDSDPPDLESGRLGVTADGDVVAQKGWPDPGWIFLDGVVFDTR
jgi:hypothetical protein